MTTNTLLVELGTEELPPMSLRLFAETFAQQFEQELNSAQLAFEKIKWFATPRRLAVQVTKLANKQQDSIIEKRGPSVAVAFDENGKPTKAAEGWARSNGISIEQAERIKTDKGEWLLHKAQQLGKTVEQLVPAMVEKALAKLPIPRPMRWGTNSSQFVRPVHTYTLMYGEQIIPGQLFGIESSNILQGHRFHHYGILALDHAENYQSVLQSAYVIADYQTRQANIVKQLQQQAEQLNVEIRIEDDLLEEVTALVEWPVVLIGEFDQAFLEVPPEPLIYSMKDHQKYFPVFDKQGNLLNKFAFVANIDSKDATQVIKGNEKVIRPRLSDAEFFFNTDKKQTLESRLASLNNVLFQKQLGTLKDKSERIAAIAQYIAAEINEDEALAHRAGLLSKTDLMTEMVLEFPQVQGIMGKYYAQNDGEEPAVAQSLEDQYKPRFAGDKLPEANLGAALAIADKIDTLVGIFGINQPPKGDKDPFALRRAAIGLLRIIIEKQLNLDVALLVNQAVALYGDKLSNTNCQQDVVDFITARFRAYYQEQGVDIDVIQAVMANASTSPLDFDQKIKAVNYFKSLAEAQALAAANKRVGNILAKYNGELATEFNAALATESAEQALAEQFSSLQVKLASLIAEHNYQAVLTELSSLKQAIDDFFEQVMVMADDEQVKQNRLTLLHLIRQSFLTVADISQLQ